MKPALRTFLFLSLSLFCLSELTHFGHAGEFFCGHEGGAAHCCAAASARLAEPVSSISVPEAPPAFPPSAPELVLPVLIPEDIFHPPAA